MNKIPYLRICVTEACDKCCMYCRPGGEACRVFGRKEMSLRQIYNVVELLSAYGISDLKITGGEPLVRKDIPKMISLLLSVKGIQRIELVTRSPRVGRIAESLRDSGLTCLNFSLDSLDQFTFYRITGDGRLNSLLSAIRRCASLGIKIKLNMVVMKGINDHEILKMIDFTGRYGAVLKLLDLMNMPQDAKFLSRYYLPFDDIEKDLEEMATKKSLSTPPGGIGTPMPTFEMPNGAVVMIKDARKGTWYGDTCQNCKYYKCQDAIMALRLTSDGCLQRCLLRSDNLVDLLQLIEGLADSEVVDSAVRAVLQTYKGAVFHKNAWKP